MLILHGLFGSSRNWTVFARKLARHCRVLTVDLRNHGNSGHAETMSYAEMAADIRRLITVQGYTQISLIGHSMGGKVAMTFALNYPAMIDRLVVLDIAPVTYHTNHHALLDSMAALPLAELRGRQHADEILAESIDDTQLRLFLLQNLMQDPAGYRWRINLAALKNSLTELGQFPDYAAADRHSGPALFLGGSDSRYLHSRHHAAILGYFSNAQIHLIDQAGHWLHIDQPEAVLDRIVPFLH